MSDTFGGCTQYDTLDDATTTDEEKQLLLGSISSITSTKKSKPIYPATVEHAVSELIYRLFNQEHHKSHHHPRSSPVLPPAVRGQRHRNRTIYLLNEFVRTHFLYCEERRRITRDSFVSLETKQKRQLNHCVSMLFCLWLVAPGTRPRGTGGKHQDYWFVW
jgi:hypothetical protein